MEPIGYPVVPRGSRHEGEGELAVAVACRWMPSLRHRVAERRHDAVDVAEYVAYITAIGISEVAI
jgi:hypothetical protein